MKQLERIKQQLEPGEVYRRADLEQGVRIKSHTRYNPDAHLKIEI